MDFIETLFDDLVEGEFIELRHQPDPASRRMVPTFYTSVKLAAQAAVKLAARGHLYIGLAPRAVKRGNKQAIHRVAWLWADLDGNKELPQWVLPPSIVVDSGYGLHLYWKLAASTSPEEAEALNKSIGEVVGGDTVWDCSRIFRVPGSRNYKRDPKGVECKELASYSFAYPIDDVKAALKVPKDIMLDIHDPDASTHKSRSERDWRLIHELLRAGLTEPTVRIIVLNSPCGNKAREQRGYLERSLTKAYSETPPEAPKIVANEHAFVSHADGYYLETGQNSRRLSTFTLDPQYVVHQDNSQPDAFVVSVRAGALSTSAVLPPECFISKDRLYRALRRVDCIWFGTERELSTLQCALFEDLTRRQVPITAATSCLGEFNGYWIGTDRILSSTESWTIDDAPVKYVNPNRPFVETDYTPAKDPRALAKSVFDLFDKLNVPTVLAPILGWTMACPFKERLWTQCQVRFPILNLIGTRGSGKTVTVNFIALPLLGIVSHRSHESSTTTYVRLTMLGSTNGLPVSLTEFRADNSYRDATFAGQLRELYDHATDSRGRSDLSTVQYPLLAPLVIDGEDPLQEAAILERLIQVRMRPETIAAHGVASDAFTSFKDLPVHQLAASYIQYVLGATPKLKEAQALIGKALTAIPIRSDRVLSNYALVIMGLLHAREWLKTLGVSLPYDLKPEAVHALLNESLFNVISRSGRTALLVDEFVTEAINHFALFGFDTKFGAVYNPIHLAVHIHLDTAYSWWVAERRKQGRAYLDKRAVRAQLDERLLDIQAPVVGQYVLERDVLARVGNKPYRTVAISLPAAAEAGLDVPRELPKPITFEGVP